MIKTLFKSRLPINNDKISFVFSGRVAIDILATKFKKNGVALIPEYICNVVDKAFEKDYKILRYRLDENFEPDIDGILDMINNNDVDMILFATIYGSGEFIQKLNDANSIINQRINEKSIKIIFDFAQDFYQIYNLSLKFNDYHYIFSFNDKSFLASMGALIVSNDILEKDIESKRLNTKQKYFLVKNYLVKIINCKIPYVLNIYKKLRGVKSNNIKKDKEFEFSVCESFPYQYINYKISNWQVLFALIGIFNLKKYRNRKQDFIKKENTILINKYISTSPYLIVKRNTFNHRLKRPYALYNNKYTSIYPNLMIIHNKGFCDK